MFYITVLNDELLPSIVIVKVNDVEYLYKRDR